VFAFGSIVLARFPFTDISGAKRRPALVLSRDNDRRADVVVCFITSAPRTGPDTAMLDPEPGTGLATLEKSAIAGRLGTAPAAWLAAQRDTSFGVFGFGAP